MWTVACSKYVLIAFNCLFWFTGCALLGAGIGLRYHPTVLTYQNFIDVSGSDPTVLHVATIFIVVGAVAFVIGFLGCCGALKEQRTFLIIYAVLLLVVTVVEAATAVLVIVYQARVELILKTKMVENVKKGVVNGAIEKTMDILQEKGECCGVVDFRDYIGSKWQNESRGCFAEVEQWIQQQATILLTLAGTIVVLEFVGITVACCLSDILKQQQHQLIKRVEL